MIKKSKGFTLVELLAVIVILGIILTFSVININNLREKEENENYRNAVSSILSGAKTYIAENPEEINNALSEGISISTLLESNYIDLSEKQLSSLSDKNVSVKTCDGSIKLKYSLEKYNDCGCKAQSENSTEASKLCTN